MPSLFKQSQICHTYVYSPQSWYLSNNYQYHFDFTDNPIYSIHKEDVLANKESIYIYMILFSWLLYIVRLTFPQRTISEENPKL